MIPLSALVEHILNRATIREHFQFYLYSRGATEHHRTRDYVLLNCLIRESVLLVR
jgi:hypothetical protein